MVKCAVGSTLGVGVDNCTHFHRPCAVPKGLWEGTRDSLFFVIKSSAVR